MDFYKDVENFVGKVRGSWEYLGFIGSLYY